MDKKIVVMERTYEDPIEKVWEAITNKDQMKYWYFEVADFKAEVKGNGIFAKSLMVFMSGSLKKQEETNLAKLKSTIEANTKKCFAKQTTAM